MIKCEVFCPWFFHPLPTSVAVTTTPKSPDSGQKKGPFGWSTKPLQHCLGSGKQSYWAHWTMTLHFSNTELRGSTVYCGFWKSCRPSHPCSHWEILRMCVKIDTEIFYKIFSNGKELKVGTTWETVLIKIFLTKQFMFIESIKHVILLLIVDKRKKTGLQISQSYVRN